MIGLWASRMCVFLIDHWHERVQFTVSGPILGLWVFEDVRKQTEQAEEQAPKQHFFMATALVPASRFLSWVPALISTWDL